MRLTRIAAALSALALALGMGALTASPASAATPTAITLTTTTMAGVYGNYNGGLNGGKVVDANGSSPYAGLSYLQRQAKGSSTWTNVATDDSPGYLYFGDQKFNGNASYRIYYAGGTSGSASWSEAYSAVMTVKTFRNLNDSGTCVKGCKLKGKVQPKYKHKLVIVQTKSHGHWKKYKSVKTNKKSKFTVRVAPARGGKKYRIVVPASKAFAKTVSGTYTATRY